MIEIKVTGVAETVARMERVQQAIDNGSILDMAMAVVLANTQRRFLQRVDPDGVPWIDSRAGFQRNQEKGNPFGTLYDTGNLFRSLGAETISQFEGVVFQDDEQAPYGVDLFDTWYFLGPSDEDMAEYTGNAMDILLKGWNGNG